MYRILLLDSDHPLRAQLIESVERTAGAQVVVADDEEELLGKLKSTSYAAVFADEELLPEGASRVTAAVRASGIRPMFIIASERKVEDLDADLVTLVVRKPYDVPVLTGILLAAVIPRPEEASGDAESALLR
jgi:CheY-like chemotaxis protein